MLYKIKDFRLGLVHITSHTNVSQFEIFLEGVLFHVLLTCTIEIWQTNVAHHAV